MIQLPPYSPTSDEQQPVYDYTIPLGGITFRVVLKYLVRPDRWYISIYTVDGVALVKGVKLVVDTVLFEDLQIPGMPAGKLALWDTADSGAECGWADLGNRCQLVYIEPEDEPELDPDPAITITAA